MNIGFTYDLRAEYLAAGYTEAETAEFDHPGSVIYDKVSDIESADAALKAQGVEFVYAPHLIAKMPDHDLWMAFLKDSEENVLALMCEKRPPAA